jgi:class 3 adenylate cyclase
VGVTTVTERSPLPRRRPGRPTVRRSDLLAATEHYVSLPGVLAVELILAAGQVVRLAVRHENGRREELTVTEDTR